MTFNANIDLNTDNSLAQGTLIGSRKSTPTRNRRPHFYLADTDNRWTDDQAVLHPTADKTISTLETIRRSVRSWRDLPNTVDDGIYLLNTAGLTESASVFDRQAARSQLWESWFMLRPHAS
ncbi:hypothetical protein P7C73_g4712, partial [Tremellales sp. Uapishka_1]